jgi:hypothetical protein
MVALAGVVVLALTTCSALSLGVALMYADGILPGVSVAGIDLGGLSEGEAAAKLQAAWSVITLKDGGRAWPIYPSQLGITLDAQRTAEIAYRQGRGEGNLFRAALGRLEVEPVLSVDAATAEASLIELAPNFELAPVNAGVQFVDGHVQATPPQDGRTLDVSGTLARLQKDGVSNGVLELAMFAVQPAVMDASPMLAEAERLLVQLSRHSRLRSVTGDLVYWSLPPEQWAGWLSATPDTSRPSGLA